ncbi:hypothetical protein GQX74_012042 [Glossina fuscipes]|nr:hypothetical protein GQX74_012042 [Glossina fuscipes]
MLEGILRKCCCMHAAYKHACIPTAFLPAVYILIHSFIDMLLQPCAKLGCAVYLSCVMCYAVLRWYGVLCSTSARKTTKQPNSQSSSQTASQRTNIFRYGTNAA